jgi:predicted nucleic acid-binding protein
VGAVMRFLDLLNGSAVFLDANVFVYHFTAEPTYGAACTSLLERVEHSEIIGWTSSHILAETSHRLMTIEACAMYGWPYQGIAARLRKHPHELQQLTVFSQALDEIAKLRVNIAPINELHVNQAAHVSRQYGLLTNDALIVAAMQEYGLTQLASTDGDFDRVPHITRYEPG